MAQRQPNSDLMAIAQGRAPVSKRDRRIAKQAEAIHDKVEVTGFFMSGGVALARHGMDEITELNDYRHRLAGDNAGLNMELLDIEVETLRGVKGIIRGYYDGWM
jgi:hypothetical protein